MLSDERYMRRALELARLGLENAAPNPMVGAVIVLNDQIIGEGYHEQCGEGHAEVNAINQVVDKSLLKEATIFVTLEPCAHYGKTPPCADLLVKHRLKKVVIAQKDPFSKVAGKGIQRLIDAGIDVKVGVLEEEARALNKRFLTFHQKQRPYIILKWAQSKDGFIDIDRTTGSKGIHWITQPETQCLTHQWRAEERAILVGVNTVLTDNPSLTTRRFSGKNPIRLVLDPHQRLTGTEQVFSDESTTHVFVKKNPKHPFHVELNPYSLDAFTTYCFESAITSVIIEGGKHTLQQFIEADLWDEARILQGVNSLDSGILAPTIQGYEEAKFSFGKDTILILTPQCLH